MMRQLTGFALAIFALFAGAIAHAESAAFSPHATLDRWRVHFDVHADTTYVEEFEQDWTLLTQRGIDQRNRVAVTYHPKNQSLELVEAWVTQPNGERVMVTPANIFVRPSQAAQNAPGFTSSDTMTVVFPQLQIGSRTHTKFRLTQREPSVIGFYVWAEPPVEAPTQLAEFTVDAPKDLALHWGSRGPFVVTETTEGDTHRIVARIEKLAARESERNMVSTSDVQPIFVMTSLQSIEELGAIYHRQAEGRAVVTPEIAALAARIVGDKTGLEAARAIYDWTASSIRYVAVYLDPNDGWVPHPAAEVLKNGYGDCKDHVVLMQALLAARGIRAEAALVDWGTRFTPLPVWAPQFNHAIIYLPDYDIYANPTNPYAPFGAMDSQLVGKLTVIATLHGQVGHTPDDQPTRNRYRVDSQVDIAPDGTIEGHSRMSIAPNLDSGMRSAVAAAASTRTLAERLLSQTPEGGFGDIHANNPHDLDHPFDVTADWRSPHGVPMHERTAYLTTPVGIDIEPANRLRQFIAPERTRAFPALIGALQYEWNTTMRLPDGYSFSRVPQDVTFRNAAGSYVATYTRDGNAVVVHRELVLNHNVVPADQYAELERLLYQPIDDARAVFVVSQTEADARG